MDFSREINKIRTDNHNKRFSNELEYLKEKQGSDEFGDEDWISERIALLEKIVAESSKAGKEQIAKGNYEVMVDELDKYIYKKKWHQLPEFHKMKKIYEYLQEKVENEDFKKKILDDINKLIYKKKLNGKNYVVYDEKQQKIISFPALKIDLKSEKFEIKS